MDYMVFLPVRQLFIFQEKERNHFSQFVTEDFSDYIKRKRCEGVQGNHLELQAISEIYSRAIEIYAINEGFESLQLSNTVQTH